MVTINHLTDGRCHYFGCLRVVHSYLLTTISSGDYLYVGSNGELSGPQRQLARGYADRVTTSVLQHIESQKLSIGDGWQGNKSENRVILLAESTKLPIGELIEREIRLQKEVKDTLGADSNKELISDQNDETFGLDGVDFQTRLLFRYYGDAYRYILDQANSEENLYRIKYYSGY